MSKYPGGRFDRNPLNAPGPFYLEDDQCVTCDGPCKLAPDLIGWFEEPLGLRGRSHCYVKKQPVTPAEMAQMIQAMQASCCSGLRYCGDDPAILERLQQAGCTSRCDELWQEPPGPVGPDTTAFA